MSSPTLAEAWSDRVRALHIQTLADYRGRVQRVDGQEREAAKADMTSGKSPSRLKDAGSGRQNRLECVVKVSMTRCGELNEPMSAVAECIGAIGRQAKVRPLVRVYDAWTYPLFLSQCPLVHEIQNGKSLAVKVLLWNPEVA
jgi:hypothetical protein